LAHFAAAAEREMLKMSPKLHMLPLQLRDSGNCGVNSPLEADPRCQTIRMIRMRIGRFSHHSHMAGWEPDAKNGVPSYSYPHDSTKWGGTGDILSTFAP
jgi:hypothetical protein